MRWEIDDDHADRRSHPGLDGLKCCHFRKEIHIVEGGNAAADHFRHGEVHSIPDERFAHPLLLQRPDMVCQPIHQGEVIRDSAEQGHRRMRVSIDQSRDEDVTLQDFPGGVGVAGQGLVFGEEGRDAAIANDQGVLLEHGGFGFDRHNPGGDNDKVCGGHQNNLVIW